MFVPKYELLQRIVCLFYQPVLPSTFLTSSMCLAHFFTSTSLCILINSCVVSNLNLSCLSCCYAAYSHEVIICNDWRLLQYSISVVNVKIC